MNSLLWLSACWKIIVADGSESMTHRKTHKPAIKKDVKVLRVLSRWCWNDIKKTLKGPLKQHVCRRTAQFKRGCLQCECVSVLFAAELSVRERARREDGKEGGHQDVKPIVYLTMKRSRRQECSGSLNRGINIWGPKAAFIGFVNRHWVGLCYIQHWIWSWCVCWNQKWWWKYI